MRVLLVLILCVLMPLQGLAALQVAAAPCPMQGMMTMGDSHSAMDEAQTMDDCCSDLATLERTGHPCKSAQECATPVAGMPSFSRLAMQAPISPLSHAPVWRSLPDGAQLRLWRPPTRV